VLAARELTAIADITYGCNDLRELREEFSARKGAVKRMLVDLVLKVNTALPTTQY
jgi:hypothetical protein